MIRAAAIQMASGSNIKANMAQADKQISQAVADGAELVVLPENFGMIGVQPTDVVAFREQAGHGVLQNFLAQQARKHAVVIVGGTLPMGTQDPNRFRNTLLVFNEQGEQVARYDKIHLFDVTLPENGNRYCESDVIEPGDSVVVVDTGRVKLGLTICYDLRFPEMFRLLQEKGAEVIVVPAAFTAETGLAHWHTLLKARAIENLCYIVASAQGGYHVNGRETYGHSLIVDPWGKVLAERPAGAGYVISDLNLAYLRQIRERFPVLEHRRYFTNPDMRTT